MTPIALPTVAAPRRVHAHSCTHIFACWGWRRPELSCAGTLRVSGFARWSTCLGLSGPPLAPVSARLGLVVGRFLDMEDVERDATKRRRALARVVRRGAIERSRRFFRRLGRAFASDFRSVEARLTVWRLQGARARASATDRFAASQQLNRAKVLGPHILQSAPRPPPVACACVADTLHQSPWTGVHLKVRRCCGCSVPLQPDCSFLGVGTGGCRLSWSSPVAACAPHSGVQRHWQCLKSLGLFAAHRSDFCASPICSVSVVSVHPPPTWMSAPLALPPLETRAPRRPPPVGAWRWTARQLPPPV